jgi:hypothetical protein
MALGNIILMDAPIVCLCYTIGFVKKHLDRVMNDVTPTL